MKMEREFEKLFLVFNQNRQKLYNLVKNIVKSDEDTEDILQETLIILYQKSTELRFETLNKWIFKVAANMALNRRKETVNRTYIPIDTVEEESMTDNASASTESQIEKKELFGFLNTLLQHLSTDEREILVLYYWNGLNYSEIGRKLGKPMNTVKTKGRRSLRKLRTLLRESHFDRSK